MNVRICPKCQSLNVHRSRRRGMESLAAVFFVRPFRCHACEHRFWGSILSTSLAPRPKKKRRSHSDEDEIAAAGEETPPK